MFLYRIDGLMYRLFEIGIDLKLWKLIEVDKRLVQ